jgi:hypothetical protein
MSVGTSATAFICSGDEESVGWSGTDAVFRVPAEEEAAAGPLP